jgi:hypothetical protein
MRPLLAVLVMGLLGCSSIDATQPAHYACSRDARSATECPGSWVCGYAGFCIDPSAPQAWACEVDSDCVGWRCGFDKVCIDPDAGVALRCLSDNDCGGGWHCGVLGLCYDARLPSAVACRGADAGDCAPGWVCGLNGLCHDGQVGAPYACGVDPDCSPGWRCGPDAMCVDAKADALRPNADAGLPGSRLVSPLLPVGLPDQVASQWRPQSLCGDTVSSSLTVFAQGATFGRLERFEGTYGGAPTGCANPVGPVDAQARFIFGTYQQGRLSFSGVRALAMLDGVSWLVAPDGGVVRVTFDGGVLSEQPLDAPLAATGVASDGVGGVLAFDDHRIAQSLGDGGWDLAPPLPSDAGPVAWANAGDRRQPQLTAVMNDGAQWLLDAGAAYSALTSDRWESTLLPRDCHPVCSDLSTPSSVRLLHGAWDFGDLVLDCGVAADGGARYEFPVVKPNTGRSCNLQPPVMTITEGDPWRHHVRLNQGDPNKPLQLALMSPTGLAAADDLAGHWNFEATGAQRVGSELLSQVPVATLGPVDSPLVAVRVSSLPVDYSLADAGLFAVGTGGGPLTAAVQGHPGWGVFSSARRIPGVPFVVVDTHGRGHAWPLDPDVVAAFVDQNPPAGAQRAAGPAGDGGTVVLSMGPTLYVADVPTTKVTDPALAPPLRFAAIVQPGVEITSLLQSPPTTGASVALVWAIAGGRVFRVRADNRVVWRIDTPLDRPTEAISLFADGPRVRVGFSDGSVYAVPSGTQLAAPLLDRTSVALDFADVCGNEFMATRDALWELVVDPSKAVGEWTRVPLSASGVLNTPLGKLQSDGTELLVYRERGVVERLTNLTCLPPQGAGP